MPVFESLPPSPKRGSREHRGDFRSWISAILA